ncbi:MAG: SDR family oxidoreductase [Dehalococcoidia bacterium]|nr:SDR family oxidoreductase [Dehalococcoidia bacterium]
MDLRLKDKVAIVTGAGGGAMGTGVCLELAREGACVVANDIDHAWADKVADQVRAVGARSISTYADVTRLEDCKEMVEKAVAEFGRVDILVTVPAYLSMKKFVDGTLQEWHKTVDLTLWGVVYVVRAVLEPMIEQKGGSIVCLGSDAGKVGERLHVMYGVAKAAVMNFAKGLAKEVGRYGIRINVVNAGVTKTPAVVASGWLEQKEESVVQAYPLGRLGEPQDLVDTVVFLASDRASFITGQSVSVSGGYTMQ